MNQANVALTTYRVEHYSHLKESVNYLHERTAMHAMCAQKDSCRFVTDDLVLTDIFLV